jgi:glycosyltransferase involved in cell wall biosynthesis/2-polyprenyl-3-methyl-5-hydroxy-6-metoxy-1,4-benzoquinol methylase
LKKELVARHLDFLAEERDNWKRKNWYYYAALEDLCASIIPEGKSVLEIGCGTGDLLAAVKPSRGVGIDLSQGMVEVARRKYPQYNFRQGDVEQLSLSEKFDYVIMSDLLSYLEDVWLAFQELKKVCHPGTRIVITTYNFIWQPVMKMAEALGLRMPQPGDENWLSLADVENLLYLTDFQVETSGSSLLLPKKVPFISQWANEKLAKHPFFQRLCLIQHVVARPAVQSHDDKELSCSVIIPCRNEVDNIEGCVERTPDMGEHTEIVFVDGNSTDGTREKIEEIIETHKEEKDIKLILQVPPSDDGIDTTALQSHSPAEMLPLGKGDAVRKGFDAASGDVLMILDADLTVPPEDLPKFYLPLAQGKAEFINGSRLVYPLEGEAMRSMNLFGNKVFSLIFTWLLGQRIKDTLCGTKVLLKKDYEKIKMGRSYFGDFDPFGDFDLLFGAARLGLKIVDVPVRYRRRTAGESKVRVIKHGWLLVRMSLIGFHKFKLMGWMRKLKSLLGIGL